MLEAFDLTGSFRDAGELAGVSHHTVVRYVAERDAGALAGDGPQRRERIIDPWLPKIEEWVERSHAKIRADRAFDKLKALGFTGSERTVRRVVAEVKANHRRGRRRVYRPWIPEPGMWAQWDWGAGPVIAGRRTNLFCAWLAPAGATTPSGRPTHPQATLKPSLQAEGTRAGCAATTPSPAGATTTEGRPTHPQAPSKPSPQASHTRADCAPTTPSRAGATTTTGRPGRAANCGASTLVR